MGRIEKFKNWSLSRDLSESQSIDKSDLGIPKIKDGTIFASFGYPTGFREGKKIGKSCDQLKNVTWHPGSDFGTILEILPNGDKKLSIHFRSLEKESNRGGGHSGIVFVFDKDASITKGLVKKLIPYVKKYREENFEPVGDQFKIKTTKPREIKAVDLNKFPESIEWIKIKPN
jgi:hypothetical protein